MLLKKVTIHKYKSFLTEQSVDIEPDITRIVGKNESGKSAFLEAVAKTNYFDKGNTVFKFQKDLDYPRTELMRIKNENPLAVSCEYEMEDDEIKDIENYFNPGILKNKLLTVHTKYDGSKAVTSPDIDFDIFKTWLIAVKCTNINKKTISKYTNFNDLFKDAEKNKTDSKWSVLYTELKKIKDGAKTWDDKIDGFIYFTFIGKKLPEFWYFSDYLALPPRINIAEYEQWIRQGKPVANPYFEGYSVVTALLELSGLTISDLKNENHFETFTATLEATSNNITDEMFEYWTTNKNLEIEFKLEHSTNLFLNIRVKNRIHRVTLPLKNRSKGFLWFFSFLVWFNKLQGDKNKNYILLLDEPGLSLHAAAQRDLLRFIEERLATDYQVIYTTHSPFMIDTLKLEQVRTIYDTQNPKVGSVASSVLEQKDSDTLFPLQAALGYTLAQNLYISKQNLLVEGISDLVYLSHFSSLLNEAGREGLNEKITIVPVGGAEKVATFVSLMRGNELNCACLLDTLTEQKAEVKLQRMIEQRLIEGKKILFADNFVDFEYADIEDLFVKADYLKLYNGAFAKNIAAEQLDTKAGIMGQLKKLNEHKDFNHYMPSRYMMEHLGELKFEAQTIDAFERVFKVVNRLFKNK